MRSFASLKFEPGARYTRTNEWARRDGGRVIVGIDDYSQTALGDVVYVELPGAGVQVRAGEPFGSLEAAKAVSGLNAPVSGTVVRVNEALAQSPGLVNLDPFGQGWMIEIAPSDPQEFDALMTADAYKSYLRGHDR